MRSGNMSGRLLILFSSIILLILFASSPVMAAVENPQHRLGLIWSDEIKNSLANHKAKIDLGNLSAAALPSSEDWTLNMPPVGDQGSQGSCVAWSMGYALRTYLYQVKTSWGDKTADHQFSPAYIYNQIDGGVDGGSSPYDAAKLLVSQGCDTLADMPYKASDYTTQPSASQKANAVNYKIADWQYLTNDTSTIKNALVSGPVWAGLTVYWTSGWQSSGDVSASQVTSGMSAAGGHGICLVGYDDNHATADGSGAFKFINSWGSAWGHSGYGWMSYQYLQKYGTGGVVLYESASPSPSPTSLNITAPAAGTSFSVGQNLPISWTATGLDKVDIYLISLKPGITVASSVSANAGSYSWTIPASITPGSYKVQINGQGTTVGAVSGWFTIQSSAPTISMAAPAAGASFGAGQSLPISWTATGLDKVDIYLISLKPGITVATSVSASAGSYSWTIPASIAPGSYKIQINGQGTTVGAVSGWFTIQAPSAPTISIAAPAAGASFGAGQNLPISWTATGLDKVDIYLISLKPGITVATSVSASAGSYTWTIPATITPGSYKIQINGQGTTVGAVSGWFTIQAPSAPTISIAAPAAGASFGAGQNLPISWTATGLNKVDIYLISLQPGITVATSVSASAGSYTWTIPANITPGSYKIQINGQGTTVGAVSEWFKIQA
ncbi:MAG TPA: Ser-Thr-rich GPI-anchored membrane family protein [Syntrophomonadaceae bacterium]|nr:Ser-Thr-rich GPI-anchored membrane family protein [Syntrophomonadaceae bacterium]